MVTVPIAGRVTSTPVRLVNPFGGAPEENAGSSVSDLIDTTEMYLRTIYELQEEGITPMRARIAERLGQSGPTVSQTVARMERDGLVTVDQDRHLELTGTGEQQAVRVMRNIGLRNACWWKSSPCPGRTFMRKPVVGST